MADISKIVVPSGDEYDIKDSTSRSGLADKMDKVNPIGSGSFSLNRQSGTSIGANSFAEGYNGTASGYGSHAEGTSTTASGQGAHAEGQATVASGQGAHAEGCGTAAKGFYCHAEGHDTTASSLYSHAEGSNTTASGLYSHAEGISAIASGSASHVEGNGTTASSPHSHAEGFGTIANHKSQHVFGEFNTLDDSVASTTERGNYVEIVGNGTNGSSRSNARTLDWLGNEVLSGTIEASGFGTTLDREVDRGGVQLTQAQYDALVSAGTVDANTTYFITDANNTTASYAAGVTYDNTKSGIDATNVQDAIDEVNNNLNDFIVTESIQTNSVTIEAGATGSVRATFVKNGYRALGIVGFQSFSSSLAIAEFSCGTGTAVVYLKNTASAPISGSGTITILFVKNFEG